MKIDYIILQKNVMSRGLRKVALCATVCENTKRPAMPSFYLIITGLFCFCHLKVPHKSCYGFIIVAHPPSGGVCFFDVVCRGKACGGASPVVPRALLFDYARQA